MSFSLKSVLIYYVINRTYCCILFPSGQIGSPCSRALQYFFVYCWNAIQTHCQRLISLKNEKKETTDINTMFLCRLIHGVSVPLPVANDNIPMNQGP